jgi:hypothetical protein
MSKNDSVFSGLIFFSLATLCAACGGSGDSGAVDHFSYPQRDSKFDAATQHYGPLVVRPGDYSAQAKNGGMSDHLPWTGYWLPDWDTSLFQGTSGNLSPLEKYDLYMKKAHGQTTNAAETEANRLDRSFVAGADGHCDAWALASIVTPEPTQGVDMYGIHFSVGDLKALIVDSYENYSNLFVYGQKYNDSSSDPLDIYPDQFQRVVQAELFDKGQPLIMDKDPGEEVWNTPIYKAEFQVVADATDSHTMHVTAYISTVSAVKENAFANNPDYVGSVTVDYIYTYDLLGEKQGDGSFLVKSGSWTGDSISDHPDFVSVFTDQLQNLGETATNHSSLNSQVSNGIVQEILDAAQNQ